MRRKTMNIKASKGMGVWAAAVLLLLSGCATTPEPETAPTRKTGRLPATSRPYTIDGITYTPLLSADGYAEKGIASWYGPQFHGRKTSNGEEFDMYTVSAAHTVLPLPTVVRVTNLENGRRLVVRVNDRGPFVNHRVIDLSFAAARILGYADKGTALVQVEALTGAEDLEAVGANLASNKPDDLETVPRIPPPVKVTAQPGLYVQAGAFQDIGNAKRLADQLKEVGSSRIQRVEVNRKEFHRVRFGPLTNVDTADLLMDKLSRMGIAGVRVVVE